MEVDGESPGDRETEVKREVWDHLPATLESHKGGGGEGRGPLRVRRLAFCQGAPKVWVFLGIFSGADQTHEGIPGLHLTQELITVLMGRLLFWRRCLPPACPAAGRPWTWPLPSVGWHSSCTTEQLLGAGDVEVGSGRATGMAQGP